MCEIWLRNDEKVDSGLSLLRSTNGTGSWGFVLTTIYLLLLYGLYVPDWEYQIPIGASSDTKLFNVKCHTRGDTGPACNAAGMIDRKILGTHHLYGKLIYARIERCSVNSADYGPLPPDSPSWCQAPFHPEGILRMTNNGPVYGFYHLEILFYKDKKGKTEKVSTPRIQTFQDTRDGDGND